jgi:hypothetical protein
MSIEVRATAGIPASAQESVLYRCNVIEIPAATASCTYDVGCSELEAIGPEGQQWAASCAPAAVAFVVDAPRHLPTSISVEPSTIRVGETVVVRVEAHPEVIRPFQFSLDGLTFGLTRLLEGSSFLITPNSTATFELRALHRGLAGLQANAWQGGGCGCLNYTYGTIICSSGASERVAVNILAADPTPCPGDCDADHQVTVDELLTGVNLVLGGASIEACPAFAAGGDQLTVVELIVAINVALNGCP